MILITGASGFLGQNLVAALEDRRPDEALRLFDAVAPPERGHQGKHRHHEVQCGDITDQAAVASAVHHMRAVVHLAAKVQPDSGDLAAMSRINVAGSRSVFSAAVRAGCQLFLHVSSAGVYGPPRRPWPFSESDPPQPVTPYQQTKWEAEQALCSSEHGNTTLNILRPAGIYGPGSYLELAAYRRILRQRWSFELKGGIIVHPTHVDDVVEVILVLLERPAPHGSVFNVGGESHMLLQDLQAELAALLGVRRRRVTVPPFLAAPVAVVASPFLALLGRRNPRRVELSKGHFFSVAVDDRLLRQQYPGIPVRRRKDGLKEHLDWAQHRGLL